MEIYKIVVSTFFVLDKDKKKRFFEKILLLVDVKSDIVLRMHFLIISNADVDFEVWNLQWRSYTIRDVFPTTRQVELIRKKEYAAAIVDPEHKVFEIHITALSIDLINKVHLSRQALIAYLKKHQVFTKVPSKYPNFVNIF